MVNGEVTQHLSEPSGFGGSQPGRACGKVAVSNMFERLDTETSVKQNISNSLCTAFKETTETLSL
jgi:hypothetical protein